MKKLLMVLGFFSFLLVMAAPVFPVSLQFDFDGDEVWDTDWGLLPGQTVEVDVWLDGDASDNDISLVVYGFLWNPASVTVVSATPYDTDNGGPWSPASSYAHLENGGEYWYKVGGPNVVTGIPVDAKIKLHTIELQYIGGVSLISTYSVAAIEGVYVTPGGGTQLFTLDPHASASIHLPFDCEITIDPPSGAVVTGETIPFSASESGDTCETPCYTWEISIMGCTGSTIGEGTGNSTGIYTAGAALPGNTCNDTVQVTDDCNDSIADEAVVNVTNSIPPTTTISTTTIPVTTTTTTGGGGGGGGGGTSTSTSVPIGGTCLNDANCNDALYCNGTEACVFTASARYSWSSSFAAATGNTGSKLGVCEKGDDPCPDDGEYCNGSESCNEDNASCSSSGNPCAGENIVCNEANDVCVVAVCVEDAACNDGLFCNGEETCVDGICEFGEAPCPPAVQCDEENDRCVDDPPDPDILSFSLTLPWPFRSHLVPLPLIMFISSTDDATTFDPNNTTVSFSGDTIVSPPPVTRVSSKLIFVLSVITPAGVGTTGNEEVEVTVTTPEGEGTAPFIIVTLPII